MKATVRFLCPACLRSHEFSDEQVAPICPRCGCGLECAGSPEEELDRDPAHDPLELTPEDLCGPESCLAEPVVPEVVGRFQLREYLGGGGYGHVYRAYDPRLDRDVALKILKEAAPSARKIERFFREARAAAQLDHPNIVGLLDAGRDGARCWIAYGYVAGQTLAAACRDAPVPPRRSGQICRALADALEHAHQRGVFHRDLKPANVLIDRRGEPRLTDFGLARRVTADPTMTQDGFIIGTPAYMSPEQAAGQGHVVDARSDVYSLGVVLFEMLCGRRPADLPSDAPTWRQQPTRVSVSPRRLAKSTPRALDRICRRALTADPLDRYPSARAMAEDLDRWLTRPRPSKLPLILLAAVLLYLSGLLWPTAQVARPVQQPVATATTQPPASLPRIFARSAPPPSPARVLLPGGRVTHEPGCQALRGTPSEHWIPVARLMDSEQQLLRPCILCTPTESQGQAEASISR